ncbi:MAG: protein-L-isoaspartate(D-aspartate) O-methyltransferase [Deltaproteobacteria bacterium]|nr:protein-L-isoaspartate(D-aspartate) O-methyltransferase [Deltaproteobacteria bacterium]
MHERRRGRDADPFEVARRRMVTEQLIPGGIRDQRILAAMGKVKRHAFVSAGMEEQAYLDRPLPIGQGQTISQPLIVAAMTEAIEPQADDRVLEIGTGSGYQAAVLAEVVKQVFSIERHSGLSIHARKILYRLHYKNISFRIGDGTLGWPEEAPFNAILVTASGPIIPQALRDQLVDGGRLVIPVGEGDVQELLLITRNRDRFEERRLTGCRFVKLVGEHGWREE